MKNVKKEISAKEIIQISENNYRESRKLQIRLLREVERLKMVDPKTSSVLQRRFGELVLKNSEPLQREEWQYQILKDSGFWEPALWQRRVFSDVNEYHYQHAHFQNAYQLAIYVLRSQYSIVSLTEDEWLFRGQSEPWPVIPTIFRSKEPFKKELENLFSVATAIVQEMGCTFNEAVAIAQHYRDGDVNTWLIDVTTDPLVALFFAALHPKPTKQGLVWRIRSKEWDKLSEGNELMGKLNFIKPEGIHRIEAQKGLFIDTPNPMLFELYVAFEWTFDHHAGVEFYDIELGITKENLLKDDTKIGQILKDAVAKNEIRLTSNIAFSFQLHAKDYNDLMIGWLKQMEVTVQPEWEIYIKTVAFVQERLVNYYESLSNGSKEKADLLHIISLHQMKIFCKTLSNENLQNNEFALCQWVNDDQIAQTVLTLIANDKEGEEVNLIREVIFEANPTLLNTKELRNDDQGTL
jgi:hypothetical protein